MYCVQYSIKYILNKSLTHIRSVKQMKIVSDFLLAARSEKLWKKIPAFQNRLDGFDLDLTVEETHLNHLDLPMGKPVDDWTPPRAGVNFNKL